MTLDGSITGTFRRRTWSTVAFLCLALCILTCAGCSRQSSSTGEVENRVLARVEVPEDIQDLKLPLYESLEDGDGIYYALVIATPGQLRAAGVSYRMIDTYLPGTCYLLCESDIPGAHEKAARETRILYDDGEWIIVRYEPEVDEILAELGFDLKMMSETPIVLTPDESEAEPGKVVKQIVENPRVREMMGKITENDLKSCISGLSGENEITVEEASYTLTTRHTRSGEPVRKATQYVFEQLNGIGNMSASFHDWEKVITGKWGETRTENRNVVAEIPGREKPEEIVLVIAHLDSINDGGLLEPAPGADDDGSGSAALMAAARVMSGYNFKRTLRFVFSTGEEQGLYGSGKYAELTAKQKIKAVINLDMISFNTQEGVPTQRVKTRDNEKDLNGYKADMSIANIYKSVVETYGLNASIKTIITPDNEVNSDQSSFWDRGFAAIWLIEDDYGNFNKDNMHSTRDKPTTLNMPYCTAIVKAMLGTAAHLAEPI